MKRFIQMRWMVLALCACVLTAGADVQLPALFSDGMVLQRHAPVKVWGWAEDGEEVTVTLNTRIASAVTENGYWEVTLAPMQAGGPFALAVTGNNTLTIQDVLVGEVWVCGGQSNMQWNVRQSTNPEATIAAAHHPDIRLFKVPVTGADEPQADVDAEWRACTPESVADFTAVGYNFGLHLQEKLGVPIGLIQSCLGGTNVSSWIPRGIMEGDTSFRHFTDDWNAEMSTYPARKAEYEDALAAHREKLAAAKEAGETLTQQQRRAPRAPTGPDNVKRPGALYNAMIRPLQPYTIQGVIWYQGESNAKNVAEAFEYRRFFPAMIHTWRTHWGQGAFPFLFVQLAGFANGDPRAWPLLREAQTMTLTLESTGMASAIDIGLENNIHPPDKKTVGQRLVDSALAVAYGREGAPSGPLYDSLKVRRGKAAISFEHASNGLMVKGGTIEGFVIAGEDRQFVPANAELKGDTVVVSSPEVGRPVAVRYAWASYGPCNLYGKNGRPVVPFRTDDYIIE